MQTKHIRQNVRRIELKTRRLVDEFAGSGYHSVFKGQGIEFEDVRPYVIGDDTRMIDWNVTARNGYPYVKNFREEHELTVMIALDVSASGDFGTTEQSKYELAAEIVALLAFSAVQNNDRVGLLLFSTKMEHFVPPRKGRRHVLRLLRDMLVHRRDDTGTDISNAFKSLHRVLYKKALIFFISDFFDEGFASELPLINKKHDLIALRLLDPAEFSGLPTACFAIEDGEEGRLSLLNPAENKCGKRQNPDTAQFLMEQKSVFQKEGGDMLDIPSDKDYSPLLKSFFRRRRGRL